MMEFDDVEDATKKGEHKLFCTVFIINLRDTFNARDIAMKNKEF